MLGFNNSLTRNGETGVFGWVHSISPFTMMIIIISIAGWILGNFNHRHVTNILFLEPLMGQYIATYIIQINNFPPLISIVGSLSTLIGMYGIRELYEREHPTPNISTSHLLETELDEVEVKKLSQFMRQSSL